MNDKMRMKQDSAETASARMQIGQLDQPGGKLWGRRCLWSRPVMGRNGQALAPHWVRLLALVSEMRQTGCEQLEAVQVNAGFFPEGRSEGHTSGAATSSCRSKSRK